MSSCEGHTTLLDTAELEELRDASLANTTPSSALLDRHHIPHESEVLKANGVNSSPLVLKTD